MATLKTMREQMKAHYVDALVQYFAERGEDAMQCGSNVLTFPITHEDGKEDYIRITVSIPTGCRETKEAYDGYAEANDYAMKVEQAKVAAEEKARKKAAKIAADKAKRANKGENALPPADAEPVDEMSD